MKRPIHIVRKKKKIWIQTPDELEALAQYLTVKQIADRTGHTIDATKRKLSDWGIKAKPEPPKPRSQYAHYPERKPENPEYIHKDGQPVNYRKPPSKNEQYNRSWKYD